jgi:hypothetical protein
LSFSPEVEPFNATVSGVPHPQTFFFAYPLCITPLGISKLLRLMLASNLHHKDQCSSAVIPGARRP